MTQADPFAELFGERRGHEDPEPASVIEDSSHLISVLNVANAYNVSPSFVGAISDDYEQLAHQLAAGALTLNEARHLLGWC